jgi:hypothetical protein
MKIDDWKIVDNYIKGWSFENAIRLDELDGNVSRAVNLRQRVGWVAIHASTKGAATIVLMHDPVGLDGRQCLYFPERSEDLYYNFVLSDGWTFYYIHSVKDEDSWRLISPNELRAIDFPSLIGEGCPPEFIRLLEKLSKKSIIDGPQSV